MKVWYIAKYKWENGGNSGLPEGHAAINEGHWYTTGRVLHTPDKLTAFEALIDEVDKRKSDTRTAINERKSHNQTIPQKMKALRKAFSILDNLVGSWVKTKPDFVRDYFNARQVIDTGGRGGGKNDKPGGGDEPQA